MINPIRHREPSPPWHRGAPRLARSLAAALATAAVALVAAEAMAQVGGQAPPGASSGGTASIFAGSMLAINQTVGATTFDKAADPTWNPSVGMTLLLAPRVRLGGRVSLSALTMLSREFTQEDWTTYRGESTLSDTFVTLSVAAWRSDALGLSLAASAQARLPTSKASLAAGTMLGSLLGAVVSWSGSAAPWGWRQGFGVAVIARGGPFWQREAESSLERPWLDGCAELASGCERFAHSGVRNPTSRAQFIGSFDWQPHPRLTLSLQGGVFFDWLAPLPTATSTAGFAVEPDPTDPSTRALTFTAAYANFVLLPSLAIAAGVETGHPQLAPDSHYRQPFFNRFSTLLVSLRVFPDAVIASLRGPAVAR